MNKIIYKKEYATERSTLINKRTCGSFGDPEGYEESIYRTKEGLYFLYTNGGAESKYKEEGIKRLSQKRVEELLAE